MIQEADPATDSEVRQVKLGNLLGQRLEDRQPTALSKTIHPPIRSFGPHKVEERRTTQLHRAKHCVVTKHLAFEIATSRSQAATAKLFRAYQWLAGDLPLY